MKINTAKKNRWIQYIGTLYFCVLLMGIVMYSVCVDFQRRQDSIEIQEVCSRHFANIDKGKYVNIQYYKSIYVRGKEADIVTVLTLSGKDNSYEVVDVNVNAEKADGKWKITYSSY